MGRTVGAQGRSGRHMRANAPGNSRKFRNADDWPEKAKTALAYDNNLKQNVITLIRTQISLSEEEYEAAKREAARLGISLAELLRRSLRSVLPVDESKPWMRYAGIVESGDSKSSQNIDDVIYGQKV